MLQSSYVRACTCRFLCRVEDGYLNNPYHCKTHGADVLRNLYVILHRGGVLRQSQKDHHQAWLLASYLAAIVHDYEHKGLNVSDGEHWVCH